jgi:hypothetical protein
MAGLVGFGVAELRSANGTLLRAEPFCNLITDAGDLYQAQKVITAIAPANATAPTAVTGMKLGTGSTAAAKNGAGAALVTYLTGSNLTFDATYPQTSNLGAGLGRDGRLSSDVGRGRSYELCHRRGGHRQRRGHQRHIVGREHDFAGGVRHGH